MGTKLQRRYHCNASAVFWIRERMFSLVLLLTILAVCANGQASSSTGESEGLKKLRDEYEQLGIKENFSRYAVFTILQQYLPAGTKFTSGFRSPEEQVSLIARLARNYNANGPSNPIPLPSTPLILKDSNSWSPVLSELRARGYIINSPLSTPHASDEVVFDMSGPDLNAIVKGCERAQQAGWMEFSQIRLEEINHAVHVQVKVVGAKSLQILGSGTVQPSGGAPGASEQLRTFQELSNQHDSTADLIRKIDYDRQKIQLLNLINPASIQDTQSVANQIRDLDKEIEEHRKEIEARNENKIKAADFDELNKARSEGDLPKAELLAGQLRGKYPNDQEAQKAYEGIKARRRLNESLDILVKGNCDDCDEAVKSINEAHGQSPNDETIKRLKTEIESWSSSCTWGRIVRIILIILFAAGMLIGLFYGLRPGQLVLECADGEMHGESFPLVQTETIIGSLGEPDGEAQIVINDRKHKISRSHCVIKRSGRRFYLKDTSANGTTVNGKPLEQDEYHELKKGDEISLADAATLIVRRK